jgi:hypothetical protein
MHQFAYASVKSNRGNVYAIQSGEVRDKEPIAKKTWLGHSSKVVLVLGRSEASGVFKQLL